MSVGGSRDDFDPLIHSVTGTDSDPFELLRKPTRKRWWRVKTLFSTPLRGAGPHPHLEGGLFQSASISPRGAISRLAKAWTGDRCLEVLDPEDESGFLLATQGEFLSWGASVSTWSPEGRFLIHGTYQHERGFLIVDTRSRTPKNREGRSRLYRDIQWGPTGRWIVSTSWESVGAQTYRYRLELMECSRYRGRGERRGLHPTRGDVETELSIQLLTRVERTQPVPSPHRARNFGYGSVSFHRSGNRLGVVRSVVSDVDPGPSPSPNAASPRRRDVVQLFSCPALNLLGELGPVRNPIEDLGWVGRNRLVICRLDKPPLLFTDPEGEPRTVQLNVVARCFAAHPVLNIGAFAGPVQEPPTSDRKNESLCVIYDLDRGRVLSRCYHNGTIETLQWIHPGDRLYALTSSGKLISHRWNASEYL